nr:MAG TPA: hypothetical protein [Caudoviricetes sp.]
MKPYQVDYKRDGVVSNIIVLASSPEESKKRVGGRMSEI